MNCSKLPEREIPTPLLLGPGDYKQVENNCPTSIIITFS